MDKFPYWHDDGIDNWAYLYDIIKDYSFSIMEDDEYDDYDKPVDPVETSEEGSWMET